MFSSGNTNWSFQASVIKFGSSPKELIQIKDSRIQGFQDSSDMLKNYKELVEAIFI